MQTEYTEVGSMEDRYFVLSHVPEEETFEEEMLLYNRIPGVLPMESGRLSEDKYHRYPVSGMVSLRKHLLGKRLTGEQFENLFTQMFATIKNAKEYLLREEGFLITPDSIYVNEKEEKVFLCYFPEYRCPLAEQMKSLSTWLLSFLDAADEKAVYNGYAFHVLCHGDTCSFQEISQMLRETPALPPPTEWEEHAPQNKPYRTGRRSGGALVLGSLLFLTAIGSLIFLVMR